MFCSQASIVCVLPADGTKAPIGLSVVMQNFLGVIPTFVAVSVAKVVERQQKEPSVTEVPENTSHSSTLDCSFSEN